MLQNLHVKNLALIEEAEIEFTKGLNIMTGETGAGKSILLGSLALALGGRYQADFLREGATKGLVEVSFLVEDEKEEALLKALSITPEDHMVTFTRVLYAGRSLSRINGETVPAKRLKEAADIFIAVHGQHEHRELLYTKKHLAILDDYGEKEILEAKKAYQAAYKTYKKALEAFSEAEKSEAERQKEADFLAFEIGEIEKVAPEEGEDARLEEKFDTMRHAGEVFSAGAEARALVSENHDSARNMLSRAMASLRRASRYSAPCSEALKALVEADGILEDASRELADVLDESAFSEEDFSETETRLDDLNRLKSRYGETLGDVLKGLHEKQQQLEDLLNYELHRKTLQKNLSEAEKILEEKTRVLSARRKKKARDFEEKVTEGLLELNFLDARFEVAFSENATYQSEGKDRAEFMIALNPGQPLKPLKEVASGGEMSRIMLTIKTVMAEKDRVSTMIFDEIDAGISGRTAQKVSEKLAIISRSRQVILITHLAQIAAMADAHYLIEKQVQRGGTVTGIRRLGEKEMIEELARILGGAEITGAVYDNASEMKRLATARKEDKGRKENA